MLVYCVPNLLIESSTNNNVTGLSIQQINQLTIDYASINLNERCNICLSKIKSGESIRKLECNHNFHSECLDKWLLEKIIVLIVEKLFHQILTIFKIIS